MVADSARLSLAFVAAAFLGNNNKFIDTIATAGQPERLLNDLLFMGLRGHAEHGLA